MVEKVYEEVRDFIDARVAKLSPEQYVEFLGRLISDLESREVTAEDEVSDNE